MWCVYVFIVVFGLGFFFSGSIIRGAVTFLSIENVSIVVTSPFQFLNLASDIGILVALIATIPFATLQLFLFLRPALSKREWRMALLLVPAACALFAIGCTYGFVSLYYGLQLIADINVSFGLENLWDVSLFIAQIAITSMLLGAFFEFPILLLLASKLGLITKQALRNGRRLAYAGIIIIVALLPPTDGISLIVMSLPLILLYELSILLA